MSGSLISFRLLSISYFTCFGVLQWRKSTSQQLSIDRLQTPEHNKRFLTTDDYRKSQECKFCRITAHKTNALHNKFSIWKTKNCIKLRLTSFTFLSWTRHRVGKLKLFAGHKSAFPSFPIFPLYFHLTRAIMQLRIPCVQVPSQYINTLFCDVAFNMQK